MSVIPTRFPGINREDVEALFSHLVVTRGPDAGEPFTPEPSRRYVNAFWPMYEKLGSGIYNTALVEEYMIDQVDTDTSRKTCGTALNHFVKSFKGGPWFTQVQADVQKLVDGLSALSNDKTAKEESMATKRGIIRKYRFIPYKPLLLSLAAGAERYPDNLRQQQTKLAFLLLAANAPLRCDYNNIVIADRCQSLPPRTPYYKDGVIEFPVGSLVKVANNESLTHDVREYQQVIDDFISKHSHPRLFGCEMEPVTFAHLLLKGSEAQLGDRLGIRFFRTKYSSDNWKIVHGAVGICKGMNNKLPTQDRYYAVKL